LDFLKRSLLLVNEHLKNSIQRRDRLKKQTLFRLFQLVINKLQLLEFIMIACL
jgi:hypothetical protein